MQSADQDHDDHCSASAEEILAPTLTRFGLDSVTYAPYILPLLTDEDEDEVDVDANAEDWSTVVDLLKASSETLAEDDPVWSHFQNEIESVWRQHQQQNEKVKSEAVDRVVKYDQESQATMEIERKQYAAQEVSVLDDNDAENNKNTPDDSARSSPEDIKRRALIDRFGYEQDNHGENEVDSATFLTNHQVAAQAAANKQQNERLKKTDVSKKEERQKTASDRQRKVEKKEQRRQKATKGERRR